ncbi:hypothetical protein CRG98_001121 [Punica granatum]|uniref:Reverse transcriptase domain-containing protein n=1 Tax=Punica granatum TaxID=22663 RepID=A0A2I0LCS6_PUNGR|nr:hypothetical protein CRG98_001121 [Punica granatum]
MTLIQRPIPTRDIVVPNQFATIQSRLAILLGLRDEEIRRELQYGWEHGIRTTWLIDFIHFRALNATGESYQRDACHGFLLLIFGTILFPHSPNLIDGALAQVILQVVGGHSYVEVVLAKTIWSLDYDIPIEADRTPYRFMWADTTASLPERFLRVREHTWRSSILRDSHPFIGYARHGFYTHRMQTSQTQRAHFKGPCARSCKPSGRSEIDSTVLTAGVTSISYSCTRKDGRRSTTRHSRAGYSANADTFSNTIDASYTTSNTREYIYSAFRHPYWTSSTNSTDGVQLCGFRMFYRTRGDESGFIELYFASGAQDNCRSESGHSSNPCTDSKDVSFSAMVYAPTVHPISDSLPPPPAPTAVPLPPTAFLSADSAMHALPPLTMPMRPPIYTVPPPTVPPTFQGSLTGSTLDWFMTLKAGDVPTWTDLSHKFLDQYRFCAETPPTLLDLSMTEMREDLIEAGKKFDMGVKLGRIEGPSRKKDGETSKRQTTETSKKIKDAIVGIVNFGHQASQLILVDYTPCISSRHTPWLSQLLFSRHHRNSMLLLKFSKVEPRFRDLLNQLNGLLLLKFNRVVPFNLVNASSTCLFQLLHPTYFGNSSQSAPGHTLDTCWRLRDKIQEMINMKPPNVPVNPLPDHGSGSGPSVNMISITTIGEDDDLQEILIPFIIDYPPSEVAFASAPFVIEVPAREPYQDSRVPWDYGGKVANMEQEMSTMGITRSGRVYQGPEPADKGKAPAATFSAVPKAAPLPTKKVTDQEAEAFMKVIKAIEYKVVEQMGKSPAHISLLALLLSSEPHRDALLKVLTVAQIPKETTGSRRLLVQSSRIRFPLSRANFHLKMNVHMSCIRASKTTVRAFDGSKRVVNGEIDLLIDVGPCSFSVTFQILEIPNAFSLLLGRPWIHAAGAVPSSLHQKLKFFVEGKLITVNGEEDYAVYKETAVLYISIGEDQNLPFHSFDTIFVIRDYEEVGPSQADCMIGKIMGGTFDGPITESDDFSLDAVKAFLALPAIYAVTEETSSGVHISPAREDEELTNWTAVPLYLAMVADMFQSNLNHRYNNSNSSKTYLEKSLPVYFGEGLDKDGHVSEIEESLHRLENRQLTSVEPTEEIDIGTAEEPRTFRTGTGLQPTQRSRMIDFLIEYQEVFAWYYADMPGLDPSIVKHFLPLRIKEEVIKQVDAGFLEIQMAEEDKIKTTFITMWGTFCYKVMPFGLKNLRTTYQRAMVTLFHDMMHKEIEVYDDDLIAKSKEGEDHLVNLK